MTIKKTAKKNANETKTKAALKATTPVEETTEALPEVLKPASKQASKDAPQKAATKKRAITATKAVSKKAKKISDDEVSASEYYEDSNSDSDFSLPRGISVQKEKENNCSQPLASNTAQAPLNTQTSNTPQTSLQNQMYQQSPTPFQLTQSYPIQPFNTQATFQPTPYNMQTFQPQFQAQYASFHPVASVPRDIVPVQRPAAEEAPKKTRKRAAAQPTPSVEDTKVEVCAIEYKCSNNKHPNHFLNGCSDKYPIKEIIGFSDGTVKREDVRL